MLMGEAVEPGASSSRPTPCELPILTFERPAPRRASLPTRRASSHNPRLTPRRPTQGGVRFRSTAEGRCLIPVLGIPFQHFGRMGVRCGQERSMLRQIVGLTLMAGLSCGAAMAASVPKRRRAAGQRRLSGLVPVAHFDVAALARHEAHRHSPLVLTRANGEIDDDPPSGLEAVLPGPSFLIRSSSLPWPSQYSGS